MMVQFSAQPYFGASRDYESARIQSLRGLACLLLVAFHVVGVDAHAGLRFASDSWPRLATNLLIHVRMPLFTFLSGFVYAYRPVVRGQELTFAKRKFLRLFVPFVVASTAFFWIQFMTSHVNAAVRAGDFWQIYVLPYEHFWFLQAIIIIFGLILILERLQLLSTFRSYLAVLIIAMSLSLLVRFEVDVFSVNRACYLAIFFLVGLGTNRFRAFFALPRLKMFLPALFVVSYTVFVVMLLTHIDSSTDRRSVLATLVGISSVLTLFYFFPYSSWLAGIGKFSFVVYLYHVFFTAGTRIAFEDAGLARYRAINFVVGLVAGLAGPIVISIAARRNALSRQALLGEA